MAPRLSVPAGTALIAAGLGEFESSEAWCESGSVGCLFVSLRNKSAPSEEWRGQALGGRRAWLAEDNLGPEETALTQARKGARRCLVGVRSAHRGNEWSA